MPEITEALFKKQIESGEFSSLYLIFGDEPFLVRKNIERLLRKAVGEDSFSVFNRQRLEGDSSVEAIETAVETLPFMAPRKCVYLHDFNVETRPDGEVQKIKKLLGAIPETTVVLLGMTGVTVNPKKSAKWRSFLAAVGKGAQILVCGRKEGAELEKLLCAFAAKRGCTLSRRTAADLVALSGNDLTTLYQEMEKLCAFAQQGEITRAMLEQVAVRNTETTVFVLTRALVAGNGDQAFLLLDQLLRQNEKPVAILAILASAYLDLYRVKAAVESGRNYTAVAEAFDYKGKEFRLRNAQRDLRGLSVTMLRKSIQLLLETDLALKSSAANDRILLERLFTKLLLLRSER